MKRLEASDAALSPSAARIRMLLLALWAISTPVLCVLYMLVPVSPDQALFDYISWMHIHGDIYYAGAAEQNFPGKMFLHELGIRLFGVHFWTFRLIDFVLLQAWMFGGFTLLRRAGFMLAPYALLCVYPALYVGAGPWMVGQRDIVAAGILLWAAAWAIPSAKRPRQETSDMLLAGAAVGYAVLIRPTYLSFLAGLMLLEWFPFRTLHTRSLSAGLRTVLLPLGFMIPIGIVVLLGLWAGNIDDWYVQSILFNVQAYPVKVGLDVLLYEIKLATTSDWHWPTLLSIVGFSLWIYRDGLKKEIVILFGLLATFLVSYFVQRKGFGYHLGGLLPVLAIMAVASAELLYRFSAEHTGRRKQVWAGLTAAAIALMVAGSVKKISRLRYHAQLIAQGEFLPTYDADDRLTYPELDEVVQTIRAGSEPDDYILQWGRHFEIGFLAQRKSTLRFISTPALDILHDGFDHTDAWLEEVRTSLETKTPKFVIIENDVLANDTLPFEAYPVASVALRMVFEHISTGYRVVKRYRHLTLLQQL